MKEPTKETDALVVAYLRAAFLDQRHHYVGRTADGLVKHTAFTVDEVAGWVTALVREYPELQYEPDEDYSLGVYSECYEQLATLIRSTFYLIPRRFYFYPPTDDPDDPPENNHNCYCACYPRFRDDADEGARWFRWHQKLHLLHDTLLDDACA